jgi:putative tricarboxylic transport membrane protein
MIKIAWGELAVAASVVAFALVVGYQTRAIPFSPLYSHVGPTIIPWLVAGLLAILGLGLTLRALTGGWTSEAEAAEPPTNLASLAWLIGGLLLNVALIGWLGFIVASTVMFVCVARAFGSTAWPRDAGIAIALCTLVFLGFKHLLGISIGAGILRGIL